MEKLVTDICFKKPASEGGEKNKITKLDKIPCVVLF